MSIAKDRGEMTITLRMKGRPVVLVGEGPVADEHRTLLTRAGAVIVGEGSKATFAVVVDDRAAVSRLKVRGALVYAVGEPDLCDFTLAIAPEPAKAARKVKWVPDSAPEPAARVPRERAVREPRVRSVKPPREPVVRAPRERLKLPNISFEPVLRTLGVAKGWAETLWKRAQAAFSPLLRLSTPLTRTVASNIQDRVERARARPISLDMALVKGGPLDNQVTGSDVPAPHKQAEAH